MSEKPNSYDFHMDLVSQKINEAVARGEFDNLPLEGKPLDLNVNPFVPPDWQLAFKVLKDNAIAPGFVSQRKKIETLRESMEKSRADERELRRLARELAAEVDSLNQGLGLDRNFSLSSLQLPPIDIEAEVARYLRR